VFLETRFLNLARKYFYFESLGLKDTQISISLNIFKGRRFVPGKLSLQIENLMSLIYKDI